MKIGNIELARGLMLAPMAGYTDRAMRLICHRLGAEYTVTEMVSARAVVYNDKKTFSLAKILSDEGPTGVQIFGSEPEIMAEAARILSQPVSAEQAFRFGVPMGADGSELKCVAPVAIDINMGCPVKKIFSNGEGSALMADPKKIEKITSAVKGATTLPVTVKIRAGIDSEHINAVDCAKAAEAGGSSIVCIHGRTTKQMYGGCADRKIIEKVKNCLQIPVIANGDIVDGASALSMLSDTGADGIAVGRGAVGNPFIFEEIQEALSGVPYTKPSLVRQAEVALSQLALACEDKGERAAIPEARKQIAAYLRAFRGAARVRAVINGAETLSEIEGAFSELLASCDMEA